MAMTLARTVLVLGGARSGKSRYGQGLVEASRLEPVFIATAAAGDGEMAARIARHRLERDKRWRLVEEPAALVEVLDREAAPHRAVLVDCLTLWLANRMLAGDDAGAATEALVAGLAAPAGPVVLISNEVGLGIVPDTPLGRRFRDAQGQLNQKVASACDAVVQVSAGLPRLLKPSPMPDLGLG